MAMTHQDRDFMDLLRKRAQEATDNRENEITVGEPDENPVMTFKGSNGVRIEQRPDDPQTILRISIGGGDHLPVKYPIDYCNFRGDVGKCISLLEKCLAAMKEIP